MTTQANELKETAADLVQRILILPPEERRRAMIGRLQEGLVGDMAAMSGRPAAS